MGEVMGEGRGELLLLVFFEVFSFNTLATLAASSVALLIANAAMVERLLPVRRPLALVSSAMEDMGRGGAVVWTAVESKSSSDARRSLFFFFFFLFFDRFTASSVVEVEVEMSSSCGAAVVVVSE